MSNDDAVRDGEIDQDSPALLVILAGGDDTLCIDALCVTGEIGAMETPVARVTG